MIGTLPLDVNGTLLLDVYGTKLLDVWGIVFTYEDGVFQHGISYVTFFYCDVSADFLLVFQTACTFQLLLQLYSTVCQFKLVVCIHP